MDHVERNFEDWWIGWGGDLNNNSWKIIKNTTNTDVTQVHHRLKSSSCKLLSLLQVIARWEISNYAQKLTKLNFEGKWHQRYFLWGLQLTWLMASHNLVRYLPSSFRRGEMVFILSLTTSICLAPSTCIFVNQTTNFINRLFATNCSVLWPISLLFFLELLGTVSNQNSPCPPPYPREGATEYLVAEPCSSSMFIYIFFFLQKSQPGRPLKLKSW